MKHRLAWFLVGALAFWAAATGVAWLREGAAAPYIAVAAVLCLLPALATMLWAAWSTSQSPEQQLAAALGGTGVRMFLVLGVGLLLTTTVPYFTEHQQSFWIWILLFYLFDLGLEMALLLGGRGLPEKHDTQGSM